jgi:hypothetical protein
VQQVFGSDLIDNPGLVAGLTAAYGSLVRIGARRTLAGA